MESEVAMATANPEKRSEYRAVLSSPIEFRVGKNSEVQRLSAEVINISAGGLRLYSAYFLCEGQEILVYDPMPNGCQHYRVQWSHEIMENFYEIGLQSLQ